MAYGTSFIIRGGQGLVRAGRSIVGLGRGVFGLAKGLAKALFRTIAGTAWIVGGARRLRAVFSSARANIRVWAAATARGSSTGTRAIRSFFARSYSKVVPRRVRAYRELMTNGRLAAVVPTARLASRTVIMRRYYSVAETIGIIIGFDVLAWLLSGDADDEDNEPVSLPTPDEDHDIDDNSLIDAVARLFVLIREADRQGSREIIEWDDLPDEAGLEEFMAVIYRLMQTENGLNTLRQALVEQPEFRSILEACVAAYQGGSLEDLEKAIDEEVTVTEDERKNVAQFVGSTINLIKLDEIAEPPQPNMEFSALAEQYQSLVRIVGAAKWAALRDLMVLYNEHPELVDELDRAVNLRGQIPAFMR